MRITTRHRIVASLLIVTLTGGLTQPAAAHEFTVAIVGEGTAADTEARVAEVVRGFIVAADERDGHANETSDGHLGGLDVQIRVLPPAAEIDELLGFPKDPADIAFLPGPATSVIGVGGTVLGPDTVIVRPGALPPREKREASSFARRFTALFGRAPTEAAEQGYNAARRVDRAIRLHSGLEPRAAIEAALAETEGGIDW